MDRHMEMGKEVEMEVEENGSSAFLIFIPRVHSRGPSSGFNFRVQFQGPISGVHFPSWPYRSKTLIPFLPSFFLFLTPQVGDSSARSFPSARLLFSFLSFLFFSLLPQHRYQSWVDGSKWNTKSGFSAHPLQSPKANYGQ